MNQTNSNFRLNAKKLYLKYENLKNNITLGDIKRAVFKNRFLNIENYFISSELNTADETQTFHIILKLKKRCNLTKENRLHLSIKKTEYVGFYQTAHQIRVKFLTFSKTHTQFKTDFDLSFLNKKRKETKKLSNKNTLPEDQNEIDFYSEENIIARYNEMIVEEAKTQNKK